MALLLSSPSYSRYLACFVNGQEAEQHLAGEEVGTFIVRLSERLDGEFVVSYVHKVFSNSRLSLPILQSGVRHYLIQPSDVTDKKKTIVDFMGESKLFKDMMQMVTQNNKRVFYKHDKDKVDISRVTLISHKKGPL